MKRLHHLTVEHYLDATRDRQGTGALALRAHRHALELCPECRTEWVLLAQSREAVLDRLAEVELLPRSDDFPLDTPAALPDRELPAAESFAAREVEALDRRKRGHRRPVRQQLWELLGMAREERVDKIRRAYRRFRSRALAEELIAQSRSRVRTDPREAANLASLVPEVLVRRLGEEPPGWASRLWLESVAQRANALRVGGDLKTAARLFTRLRAEMARREVADPALIAKVASLEASLNIDQRSYAEAAARLGLARLGARRAGDRELYVRVLLQDANLQGTLGNPEQSLERFAEAAALLRPEVDGYLALSVVTGRIVGLCDLERFAEAEEVLCRHQEVFEGQEDPHVGATLSALRGRLALGLGRLDEAVAAFGMARESLLALGRHYDAALACLDLAEAHLRRGDAAALRRLAARLGPLFQAHGVERETLAALRLLARAVVAEELSASVLKDLRERLKAGRSRSG